MFSFDCFLPHNLTTRRSTTHLQRVGGRREKAHTALYTASPASFPLFFFVCLCAPPQKQKVTPWPDFYFTQSSQKTHTCIPWDGKTVALSPVLFLSPHLGIKFKVQRGNRKFLCSLFLLLADIRDATFALRWRGEPLRLSRREDILARDRELVVEKGKSISSKKKRF